MSASTTQKLTRRQMLKSASAAGVLSACPAIVPSSVFGKNAPSNRITVGMIGVGRQGMYANLNGLLNLPDVQIVAICDVDRWRMQRAKDIVDKKYGDSGCRTTTDFREVIARDDVDAIMNSTPDHWHVPISLAAIRRRKHVSCEKPLTLALNEGRVLADAVKKHGVVFRTDTECRSHPYMHKTVELVRNGYLGKIKRYEIGVPRGDRAGGKADPMPVPEELDYEMWLGPIEPKPYTLDAVHPRQAIGRPGWMHCRDTCEGMITNWGTHVLDVAQLANNTERTGPISVEGTGKFPEPDSGMWDLLLDFQVQFKYADGMIMDYRIDDAGAYVRVEGEDGWIQANWHRKARRGFDASYLSILQTELKSSDLHFPERSDKEDFIHAIKNNAPEQCMVDAEIGHRTCSMGQIAHIAIQRGRKLDWDLKKEKFTNDSEANKMLSRTYLDPWGLDIKV